MSNIFVVGVYGVGKTTFSKELSNYLDFPYYNASDLIKLNVNETYEQSKHVKNRVLNQKVLIENVNLLNSMYPSIILTGHFCIFTKDGNPDEISLEVIKRLNISTIILIFDKPVNIYDRMKKRDNYSYSVIQIQKLQQCEKRLANDFLKKNSVNFYKFEFNELKDVDFSQIKINKGEMEV